LFTRLTQFTILLYLEFLAIFVALYLRLFSFPPLLPWVSCFLWCWLGWRYYRSFYHRALCVSQWFSYFKRLKKKDVISRSSAEAEYRVIADTIVEII